MKETTVRINNKTGLHARPAGVLAKEVAKYKSSIFLIKNGKEYNLKSIMSIMAMGAAMGDELVLKANGEDEDKAVTELKTFIETLVD